MAQPRIRNLMGLKVDVLQSAEQLELVRQQWTELALQAERCSVFMTWEWQSCWWQHYGQGQALRVLLVRRDTQLIGLLPLYIQSRSLLSHLPLQVLRPLGTGGDTTPDYLEPLYRRGYERLAARCLASCILEDLQGWHIARLSDLWPDSPLLEALVQLGASRKTAVQLGEGVQTCLAVLPSSWDEFLAAFSKDRLWNIRYARRRLMRETGARFVVWDNAATLDLAIDRLIELHAMRWEGRTERHAFSSTAYVGFHREVMHEMFARQMLRLYALEVAGTVVAMLYCYRFRDGIYYFQGGFDPGLSKLSPGSVLLGLSIESAIAEGCKVFDMLRGMHDYKAQWARQRHQMMELELFRTGLTSSLYRLRHDIAPRLKRGLEDLVGASR